MVMVILVLGSVIAGILVLTAHLHVLAEPFDAEPHAWGSAHFATIARSYAEQGFIALKGLPIGNNPPLGREPDAYIHWPPLFSILLGIAFKAFGISEAVARGFALFIGACVVIATGWLAKLCYGHRAGAAAIFSMLTVPVFCAYVCLVQLTTLGIFFMLLALIGFLKATGDDTLKKHWMWCGLIAMFLSVSSSWEPALLPFGLLLSSLIQRNRTRIRLALAYFGAAFAGITFIMSFYFISMPSLAGDFLQSVLFRAGFGVYSKPGHLSLHSLVNSNYYRFQPTMLELLHRYSLQFIIFVGWPYLVATLLALALSLLYWQRFSQDSINMPLVLLTPVVLWYALMSHQAFDNEFEILLSTPLVTICFALLLSKGWDVLLEKIPEKIRQFLIVPILVLVIVLLLPVWRFNRNVYNQRLQPTGLLDYARDIKNNTEPNAVVISPLPSMVPVFYSHRHIIRGISDRKSLQYVMERVGSDFPGSPVYLALPGDMANVSARVLGEMHVVTRNEHLLLILLSQGTFTSP
jgi:hypothetical protein